MRVRPANLADDARGATPQLTVAKHLLRDWLESQLPPQNEGEGGLAARLNAELRAAGLFCDAPLCENGTWLGYLNEIRIHRTGPEMLVLQTSIGIVCGFDDSAYLYKWSSAGWRRIWASEQNVYTKQAYRPQMIESVNVSDDRVLTLGIQPWCSSTWRGMYYRAYRLGRATPILDKEAFGWLTGYPPIRGSITRDDILVEFTIASMDPAVHSRPAILHYSTKGAGPPKRIDPVALSPRDFVEEWLGNDWNSMRLRTETALGNWHRRLRKVGTQFVRPTSHCAATPDLWQVGVELDGPEPQRLVWFLIRWKPPYRFTMVRINNEASPACTEDASKIDDERHTLFPPPTQR